MNKKKIIGIIFIIVLVGVIIFASVHKFDDNHLRIDGVRVRLQEHTFYLEDYEEQDAIHAKRTIEVGKEKQTIELKYLDFKEDGYPTTISISINNHEFYRKENINLKTSATDYTTLLNFEVIDDAIIFSLTTGQGGNTTTLYAIDKDGNILLEEYLLDTDDMKIDDGERFFSIDKNKVTVLATRLASNTYYQGKSLCETPDKTIIKASYTYTYSNHKFTKKQASKTTAKEYRDSIHMTCTKK